MSDGTSGNDEKRCKQFPANDVRSEPAIYEHEVQTTAPGVDPDTPIDIRFMRPEEATALAHCVFRSYGYSYDADWVYQPDVIAEKIIKGDLRSCIGVTADGEIVGHAGMTFIQPGSRVAESGQAVVDPRFRGHHIFTSLKRYMANWATQEGMYGLYSEATAFHPYSQKANLELGAHETGLLLGYIPKSVDYKAIETTESAESQRRQSVTLFYLKTNNGPERSVYAPARHRDIIGLILATSGIHGELTNAPLPALEPSTRIDVHVREDHNQAIMSVETFGREFIETIRNQPHRFCEQQRECIYVDLPLVDPATAHLGDELDEMGFFFGGIFPNLRGNGDVLRLQFLNNVNVHIDDIQVASDLGRRLLHYIQQSRHSQGGN